MMHPDDPTGALAREAARKAQENTAAAITAIATLGAAAPGSLREALQHLGLAFAALGYADPMTPYSVASTET